MHNYLAKRMLPFYIVLSIIIIRIQFLTVVCYNYSRQPVPSEDWRRAVGPSHRANYTPEGGCRCDSRRQSVRTEPKDTRWVDNSVASYSQDLLSPSVLYTSASTVAAISDHTLLYVFISPDIVHPSDAAPASGSPSRYIHAHHCSRHVFRVSTPYICPYRLCRRLVT